MGCHTLLQGIFPTQGSNPHLLSYSELFTTEPPEKPHTCYICNKLYISRGSTCASCISCIGRQILDRQHHWEASYLMHDVCYIIKVLSVSITTVAAAAAKSLQSCPTLCDSIDGSSLGSPIPGILQARTLEWVAISFSNAWKLKIKVKSLSRVRLLATPWTAAYQALPSMGFSRQEYWSGVPLPSPNNGLLLING